MEQETVLGVIWHKLGNTASLVGKLFIMRFKKIIILAANSLSIGRSSNPNWILAFFLCCKEVNRILKKDCLMTKVAGIGWHTVVFANYFALQILYILYFIIWNVEILWLAPSLNCSSSWGARQLVWRQPNILFCFFKGCWQWRLAALRFHFILFLPICKIFSSIMLYAQSVWFCLHILSSLTQSWKYHLGLKWKWNLKCELISSFIICIFHFKGEHSEKKLHGTNTLPDKLHTSHTIP